MPQKYFGTVVSFPEKTADIRMAQYESSFRTLKSDLTNSLAEVLGVSLFALSVPDIDNYLGLLYTLFISEDRHGLTIEKNNSNVSMRIDPRKGKDTAVLCKIVFTWMDQAEKYHSGEIIHEDYDRWRYNYPKYDEAFDYVKVPPQELSNAMVEAFKDK